MAALVKALIEQARRKAAEGAGEPASDVAVLVTGVDHPVGAAVARELVVRGFTVHGTAQSPTASAADLNGGWHLVPRAADPSYLPVLHRIVERHRTGFVIPTLDAELPVWAGVRRWPGAEVVVVVAGAGAVSLAQDKLLTCWQLSSHQVPTPPCSSPSDFTDTAEALQTLGGRLVVRPRWPEHRYGGARLVHAADDLVWDRLDDHFVVQPVVCGAEYLCTFYRPDGSARRGTVVFQVQHPSMRRGGLRPLAPGEDPAVERAAWAAVRALGILGPAEVVVRRGEDGAVSVLSVHPRFGERCGELLDQLSAPEPVVPRQRVASEPLPTQAT